MCLGIVRPNSELTVQVGVTSCREVAIGNHRRRGVDHDRSQSGSFFFCSYRHSNALPGDYTRHSSARGAIGYLYVILVNNPRNPGAPPSKEVIIVLVVDLGSSTTSQV